MNKHTPGPLDIFGAGVITLENGTTHEVQVLTAKDQRGNDEEVAYCFDVDRAAYIVRACNAHEELVKALKAMHQAEQEYFASAGKGNEAVAVALVRRVKASLLAEAAIAKAEGRDLA